MLIDIGEMGFVDGVPFIEKGFGKMDDVHASVACKITRVLLMVACDEIRGWVRVILMLV